MKKISPKKVILFSPNLRSAYSLAVLKGLIDQGIKVEAVVVVSLLNFQRIRKEINRDWKSLLNRVFKKVIKRNAIDGKQNLTSSISQFAKQHKVKAFFVSSLNSPKAQDILRNHCFEAIVFTGGGIIGKETLKLSNKGIINCHSGVLPYYRGMDCHKWAILNNDFENIGCSCHLMTELVDRGDLIRVDKLNIAGLSSIDEIEKEMEELMTQSLVKATKHFLDSSFYPLKQDLDKGKNYYTMHSFLESRVRKILLNYR